MNSWYKDDFYAHLHECINAYIPSSRCFSTLKV